MAMEGVRPEQGPPLAVPLSFFFTAPIVLFLAGSLLVYSGAEPLSSRWVPITLAITHLGTLGFLTTVILGASYQMIAVVAGAPVPWVRLAHLVHAGLLAGLGALAGGLATGDRTSLWMALWLLGVTVVGFLVPVSIALARAPTRSDTVTGMRLALAGFVGVAVAGLVMAYGMLDLASGLAGARSRWLAAHVGFGLLVWVGGLITSVSWQVIPMFYLTSPIPRWSRLATLASIGATIVLIAAALPVRGRSTWVAAATAPAAAAVWLLHPLVIWRALTQRRRRRADGSLLFWRAGLACAPLVFATGLGMLLARDARWAIAFGWLAIWGWAGMIVHGMLTRIVPFLVWFHHYAPLVGQAPVPSMRDLFPESAVRRGLWLHGATLLVGCAALVTGSPSLGVLMGIGLVGTGASLGFALLGTLRAR